MPHEIELKFRCGDLAPVRRRLRDLGATGHPAVLETNHILDTDELRLRNAGCGLRVRQTWVRGAPRGRPDSSATLTFKGPREKSVAKSREELETHVADAQVLLTVLARLGFSEVIVYEKCRETWTLGPCEIALDELPRLGSWLEVEGPSEAAIAEACASLGLSEADAERATYVEMAAIHGDRTADGRRELLFPST